MDDAQIARAIEVLKNGGVVAHATDTCYGFACDAFNKEALERLYALKDMVHTKPTSILVDSYVLAEQYAEFSDKSHVLAKQYWPGALTLVLPRKGTLPDFLNPGVMSVGIRVPNHEISRRLALGVGHPITTTSANVSGLPSPYTIETIKDQFKGRAIQPDFYLDSGPLNEQNLPSTIVDLTGSEPRIIRQGSLTISL